MQLVILSAGAGSRLQPYSDIIPKSMMPVDGVPIISRIFDKWAIGADIYNVIICVNRGQEKFFKHEFRDVRGDVRLVTSSKPLGTAGEVWNARKYIKENFVLYYGDMLTNIDPIKLLQEHIKSEIAGNGYIGTLAVVRGTSTEKGIVESDDNGNVIKFTEKPPLESWTWAAIGVFENKILQYCSEGMDFGSNVFTKVIEDGHLLKTCKFDALWCDIGNIKNYELANQLAVEGKL